MDRRVPAELGQESQESSCLRKGTPLASRGPQGASGPSSKNEASLLWCLERGLRIALQAIQQKKAGTRGSLRTMHGVV